MGFIHVDVEIANPALPDVSESVRVLVDTGATLSVLPASLLKGLGIRSIDTRRFRSLGGVELREVGGVIIQYRGDIAGVTAVFGAEDYPPIMGVTALESLGYEIDPVAGRLNRIDMLML